MRAAWHLLVFVSLIATTVAALFSVRSSRHIDLLEIERGDQVSSDNTDPVCLYSSAGGLYLDFTSWRDVIRSPAGSRGLNLHLKCAVQLPSPIADLNRSGPGGFGYCQTEPAHPLPTSAVKIVPLARQVFIAPWLFVLLLTAALPALALVTLTLREGRRTPRAIFSSAGEFLPTRRAICRVLIVAPVLLWARSIWGRDTLSFNGTKPDSYSFTIESTHGWFSAHVDCPQSMAESFDASLFQLSIGQSNVNPMIERALGWLIIAHREARRQLTIPYWLMVPALSAWPLAACISRFREIPAPAGHCQACGYNLHGINAARCPECGFETTPTRRSDCPRRRIARRAAAALAIFLLAFCATATAKALTSDTRESLVFIGIRGNNTTHVTFSGGTLVVRHWAGGTPALEWEFSRTPAGTVAAIAVLALASACVLWFATRPVGFHAVNPGIPSPL